jgi:hypothetical protein
MRQRRQQLVFVLILLGMGCHGGCSVPATFKVRPVGTGHFQVVLHGAVEDTLVGNARFRLNAQGELVGLDLIDASDATRGLSLEIGRHGADTLEAVRRLASGPVEHPWVIAYLAWPPYTFLSETGQLVFEAVDADQVEGTFRLHMGAVDRTTGEYLELEANGTFVAVPDTEFAPGA